ncbi:B3/B4 domain-containing protein [Yunchengibacter salinarum]|uniref:B3/B4 domain-containing protein n=1 Tax=Yunchengibacter salinarum TaxID=3133399 RepID=UPI0035B636D6
MDLRIDQSLPDAGVEVNLGIVLYDVTVAPADAGLNTTLDEAIILRREELAGHAASSDGVIAAMRGAFKACGKDPARYRPSSESLTRRVINGKDLARINNVVDCGTVVSLMTGLPVGCYDAEKLTGNLVLRVAGQDESYDGLGRGPVNLAGLPVLADEAGPFGSPFSDSTRTAVTETTQQVLFVLYGLDITAEQVDSAGQMADTLIRHFCTDEDLEAMDTPSPANEP